MSSVTVSSQISNKQRRSKVYAKEISAKKVAKKRRKEERERKGEKAPEKKTLDTERERDDTVVEEGDREILADEEGDEWADYFRGEREPKIMLTTSRKPTADMFHFLRDISLALPHALYYKRGNYCIKEICQYASNNGFTDLMVFTQHRKKVNGLIVCHLPNGPTATYKLTNVRLREDIRGVGEITKLHRPEVILNRFTTRLGQRIGRQLAAIFPSQAQFKGRQVVTFHNQRDFVFFRHHRYLFSPDGQKVRLQEIGPRFTMRLQSLQSGVFDSKKGEYEWIRKKESDLSRRKFHL